MHQSPFLQKPSGHKKELWSLGASHGSSLTSAGVDSDGWLLIWLLCSWLGRCIPLKNMQCSGRTNFYSAAPQGLTKISHVLERATGKGEGFREKQGAPATYGNPDKKSRKESTVRSSWFSCGWSEFIPPGNMFGNRSRSWTGMVPQAAEKFHLALWESQWPLVVPQKSP